MKDAPHDRKRPEPPVDPTRREGAWAAVRGWLDTNRVFFETIAAAALTCASIFVSWQQNELSKRQTQIADLQTRIMESESAPHFRLLSDLRMDDRTRFYSWEALHVFKDKGVALDVSARAYTAFIVPVYSDTLPMRLDSLMIPVTDYYDVSWDGGTSQDTLWTFANLVNISPGNWALVAGAMLELARSGRSWRNSLPEFLQLVRVDFTDALGRHQVADLWRGRRFDADRFVAWHDSEIAAMHALECREVSAKRLDSLAMALADDLRGRRPARSP